MFLLVSLYAFYKKYCWTVPIRLYGKRVIKWALLNCGIQKFNKILDNKVWTVLLKTLVLYKFPYVPEARFILWHGIQLERPEVGWCVNLFIIGSCTTFFYNFYFIIFHFWQAIQIYIQCFQNWILWTFRKDTKKKYYTKDTSPPFYILSSLHCFNYIFSRFKA